MLQCRQSPILQVAAKATIQASDEQQFHHPEVLKSCMLLLLTTFPYKFIKTMNTILRLRNYQT